MRSLATMLFVSVFLCGCDSHPAWKHQTFAFSVPAATPAANSSSTNMVALRRVSISPLFQSRSFTYRTAENTYEQDPYASFLASPERAVGESMRAWMQESGVFGRVLEPGSSLSPTLAMEVSINELYGDFRKASQPVASMKIHFMVYECDEGSPGRVVLDRLCARDAPLAQRTPVALMAGWDADLREIMVEIDSDYAKANSHDSGR